MGTTDSCDRSCCPDDRFDFNTGWEATALVICTISVLYVILDYTFNSRSRGNPSRLMLSRAVFDYLSVLTVFYAIHSKDIDQCTTIHSHNHSICKFWGATFLFTLYVPAIYYSSICWQLYLTLKNPFRQASSRSIWYHLCVLLSAFFVVLFVATIGNHGNGQFQYRQSFQICFLKQRQSTLNLWNVFVVYIPTLCVVIGGIIATYWSIRQLKRRTMDETFKLRWVTIKKQTAIITSYTINYAFQAILWIIIINDNETKPVHQPYILSVFCVIACLFDGFTWFIRNFVQKKYEYQDFRRKQKIENKKKNIKKKNIKTLSDALRKEVITFITQGLANAVVFSSKKNLLKKKGHKRKLTADDLGSINSNRNNKKTSDNIDYNIGGGGGKSLIIGKFAKIFNPNITDDYFLMSDDEKSDINDVDDDGGNAGDNDNNNDGNLDDSIKCELQATDMNIHMSQISNVSNANTNAIRNDYDDVLSDKWYPKKIDGKITEHIIDQYPIGSVGAENSNVLFTDYAPIIFGYLRRNVYKISDIKYKHSILPPNKNVSEISLDLIAKFSEGRSGAFFFFTSDMKYLIKTLTKDEAQLLLNTLKKYVNHMINNHDTYLSKYLGLHSIRLYSHNIYFVVNKNVFPANYKSPDETYDIKGSWIDRHTNHHISDRKLMKDEDLHSKLLLSKSQSSLMYQQLYLDTQFLSSVNIMDYSLLLGIYYTKIYRNNRFKSVIHLDMNQLQQQLDDEMKMDDQDPVKTIINTNEYDVYDATYIEGPGRYCIGIIDMLQEWDLNKQIERFIKMFFRRKDGDGISCIEPLTYQKRFLTKMRDIGISDENEIKKQLSQFKM